MKEQYEYLVSGSGNGGGFLASRMTRCVRLLTVDRVFPGLGTRAATPDFPRKRAADPLTNLEPGPSLLPPY